MTAIHVVLFLLLSCQNWTSRRASGNLQMASPEMISDFEQQLSQTPFSIFRPQADLGFYKWIPSSDDAATQRQQRLEDVQANEGAFTSMIDLDGTPDNLIDPDSLSFPKKVAPAHTAPQTHKCCYPYGQLDIPGLFVATNHRGVDLNNDDIDFVFGGTALNMLATQIPFDDFYKRDSTISYYYAVRIPGTKTIMVAKRKAYEQDYQSPSFRFERLMTGKNMKGKHPVEFAYHLHLMKIGDDVVLFNAETDALYQGSPVEIKANNPRYWQAKVFFQMIGTGSPIFCHGRLQRRKSMLTVKNVRLKSLSQMARWVDNSVAAVRKGEWNSWAMQQNILKGMRSLKSKMSHAKEGQAYRIHFCNDDLNLVLMDNLSPCYTLLPPNSVVKSLLDGSKGRD